MMTTLSRRHGAIEGRAEDAMARNLTVEVTTARRPIAEGRFTGSRGMRVRPPAMAGLRFTAASRNAR